MSTPFKPESFVREVLLGTAARWATWLDLYLESFQTARETDTGAEKTGPGLFGDLPYDDPQGLPWLISEGVPASTDLIGYTAVTAAVAATSAWTCNDVGTVGATIIVGNKLYSVVASGATGDQINAGATATEYAANIATKVTTDTIHTLCTAVANSGDLTFTANTAGAADIQLSTNDPNIDSNPFADGADAVYVPMAATFPAPGGGNVGYLNIPINSQTDDYTAILTDAGKGILETGASKTITIPANASVAYPLGTALTFLCTNASGCSIAITSDTMTLVNSTTTGTRTLAQNGLATAIKLTATTWLISGVGIS